jgi:hypothetical protein
MSKRAVELPYFKNARYDWHVPYTPTCGNDEPPVHGNVAQCVGNVDDGTSTLKMEVL